MALLIAYPNKITPKMLFEGNIVCFGGKTPAHSTPTPPEHHALLTFALGHGGGAVEVGGGVAGAGDAVILPKIGLVGAHGAANAAVDAGVVVVPGRALDWGSRKQRGLKRGHGLTGPPWCPRGLSWTYLWCHSPGRRGLPRAWWSAPRRRGSRAPAPPRAGRSRGGTAGRA